MTVVFQTLAGLAFLYAGGELVIRGASELATRLGISKLTIGLTVVAVGTSTPELVVSLGAALSGANDISLGNVVGSNIANIGLILGVAALLTPLTVHARLVRVHLPLMLLVSVGLVLVMADGEASRMDGGLLLLGLIAYVAFTFWEPKQESEAIRAEFEEAVPASRFGPVHSLFGVLIGLGLLMAGGRLLVTAAVDMASSLGVPQAVIGLSIVAVGTSLPEAAATVIAALRGHGDIAIGNAVGSNIFNVLGILGVTSVVRPLDLGFDAAVDFTVMVGLAAALWLLVSWRGRFGRPGGLIFLSSWIAYLSWLLATRA